jgi:hypothetical protein
MCTWRRRGRGEGSYEQATAAVEEVRADGGAVREDDAEPDLLEDEEALEDGAVVTMSVKDVPLLWRTFPEENVPLSDSRAVATRVSQQDVVTFSSGD